MAEAEDPDRWGRIDPGDVVLWQEPDGSRLRWLVADGRLRRNGAVGPSVHEATLGLSTTAFVKIWDGATCQWAPRVPAEVSKPPSLAWLELGEGDRVVTDVPDGYSPLSLRLEGGRWCPEEFPYGARPWLSPARESAFWAEHGSVEERIASGRWHKAWDARTRTFRAPAP